MTSLVGAHVLITGGSEGIGLETARLPLTRGAHVSIVSRGPEKLAAARASLGKVTTASADVTDRATMRRTVRKLG